MDGALPVPKNKGKNNGKSHQALQQKCTCKPGSDLSTRRKIVVHKEFLTILKLAGQAKKRDQSEQMCTTVKHFGGCDYLQYLLGEQNMLQRNIFPHPQK